MVNKPTGSLAKLPRAPYSQNTRVGKTCALWKRGTLNHLDLVTIYEIYEGGRKTQTRSETQDPKTDRRRGGRKRESEQLQAHRGTGVTLRFRP